VLCGIEYLLLAAAVAVKLFVNRIFCTEWGTLWQSKCSSVIVTGLAKIPLLTVQ
jgi:hypothetical protein